MDNVRSMPFSMDWSNYPIAFSNLIEKLYNNETFADCSLMSGDGIEIPAHKIVLSAASPLFNTMLQKDRSRNPVIMLPLASYGDLLSLTEFIYKGTVDVDFDRLQDFLKLAKSLKVDGLVDEAFNPLDISPRSPPPPPPPPPPTTKVVSVANILRQSLITAPKKYLPKIEPEEEELNFPIEEAEVEVDYLSDESSQGGEKLQKDEEYTIIERIDDDSHDSIFTDVVQKVQIGEATVVRRRKRSRSSFASGTRNYNIRCDACSGLYKSESTFNNHLKHDCNKLHNCSACKKTFKNKRHLLDHVRDDCGRIHKCPSCSKEFKQKVNLTTHMKIYCKSNF